MEWNMGKRNGGGGIGPLWKESIPLMELSTSNPNAVKCTFTFMFLSLSFLYLPVSVSVLFIYRQSTIFYIFGLRYSQRFKILLKMSVHFNIDRACDQKWTIGNILHCMKPNKIREKHSNGDYLFVSVCFFLFLSLFILICVFMLLFLSVCVFIFLILKFCYFLIKNANTY